MKRHLYFCALSALLVSSTALTAQQRSSAPGTAPRDQLRGAVNQLTAAKDIQDARDLVQRLQSPNLDPAERISMLRELERFIAKLQDDRAARSAPLPQVNPDLVGEIKLILAPVDGDAGGRRITAVPVSAANGAWWTNAALVARLGLTEDQKARIERAFESNRQNLAASKDLLEKEETQLSKLLAAEPLDRMATVAQIHKVVQARGEMERINSLMTLEMRGVLTRAQWTQLESQQGTNRVLYYTTPQPGLRGADGRGASPVKQ